jgi:chromosome segregation ATPase
MSKIVKLLTLVLTNYRNIDYATFQFNGDWSKIVGENRIGKTNTLEAIYWLLTDKLLTGSSDIAAIKCLADTTREVRVEATFDVDGKTVTLKKEYGENWTRTRGTDQIEMKGHYNTYYFNNVKQPTVKAYQTLLNETFGITCDLGKVDTMRMLIDPTYLGELGEDKDWVELRNFIINLIGDVKDSDVFIKNPTLKPIESDLYSVDGRIDQLKKRYKGEIDGLNDAIIGNDAQIQMLETTDHPSDEEVALAKKMVEDCDEKINSLQNERSQDKMVSFLNHQINEKEKEINICTAQLLKNNPMAEKQNKVDERKQLVMDKISNVKSQIWDKTSEIKTCETAIQFENKSIESLESARKDWLAEYHELNAKIKDPSDNISLVCPTCNRPFENKDEIIETMVKQWKAKQDEVLVKGKECAKSIEEHKAEKTRLESELEKAKRGLSDLESLLKANENAFDEVNKERYDLFEKAQNYKPESEELTILNHQLIELKDQLEKVNKSDESKNAAINDSIAKLNEQSLPYRTVIEKHSYWKFNQDQLEKVQEKRQTNARLLAATEQKKEMLNTFIYTKLKMLDERVASVFGNIKFQLIKENINGGFDAVCKPYIYDIDKDESTAVLWKSGSKSERIVTGIAIAERVKSALDLPNLPFLFDEGGEISSDTFATKFKTQAQLICVKVQDNIKKPTVLKI